MPRRPLLRRRRDEELAKQWVHEAEEAQRKDQEAEERRKREKERFARELKKQAEEQKARERYHGESDLGLTKSLLREKGLEGELAVKGTAVGAEESGGAEDGAEGRQSTPLTREEVMLRRRMG